MKANIIPGVVAEAGQVKPGTSQRGNSFYRQTFYIFTLDQDGERQKYPERCTSFVDDPKGWPQGFYHIDAQSISVDNRGNLVLSNLVLVPAQKN